ncbi:hypothetical protein GE09DRAFT_1237094 [Coniochaeta sp. 2T2.1]|nr:hypothetical protein GE09DRAFT_1237094 [Coniochaeta sp. 2T2.1]
MPRLTDEEDEPLPYGIIGTWNRRVTSCIKIHRKCSRIHRDAEDAVRRMLDMRTELWSGRILKRCDFNYWHRAAQLAIADTKPKPPKKESEPEPVLQVPHFQPSAPARPASFVESSPAPVPRAPQPSAPVPIAPQQDVAMQYEEEEYMDINNMGVGATLHAILKTLIKIDRRMEALGARI